jgi:hypothetical protein
VDLGIVAHPINKVEGREQRVESIKNLFIALTIILPVRKFIYAMLKDYKRKHPKNFH